MEGVRVLWCRSSPLYADYVAWGPEPLQLARVSPKNAFVKPLEELEEVKQPFTVSVDSWTSPIKRFKAKTCSSYPAAKPALKCFDWSTWSEDPFMFAAGSAAGSAVILSFKDFEPVVLNEFAPRYSRRANDIALSPGQHSARLVAVALEKVRNANCGLVWDVSQLTGPDSPPISPVCRFSNSEAVHCLSWLPYSPSTIAVGAGFKWLRLYDIRDRSVDPVSFGSHQKTVQGIVPSPFQSHVLASFSEDGTVKIWDVRGAGNICSFSLSHNPSIEARINCVRWSCTKEGILGISETNGNSIHIFDCSSSAASLTKSIHFQDEVSSFDWHPSIPNHIVKVTQFSRDPVEISVVHETQALSWSSLSTIATSNAESTFSIKCCQDDIMHVMRERALRGYRLGSFSDPDSVRNESITSSSLGSESLRVFWECLKTHTSSESKVEEAKMAPAILGIRPVFEERWKRAEISLKKESSLSGLFFFESQARSLALSRLGWFPMNRAAGLLVLVKKGALDRVRAATLCIFHLDFDSAVKCLQMSEEDGFLRSDADLLSIVLAGFPLSDKEQPPPLWNSTLQSLLPKFKHPYLRAALAFLCDRAESLAGIANSDLLNPLDRLAFVCRYFSDETLKQYMDAQFDICVSQGNLSGLFICGLPSPGSRLVLSSYLDHTGDIQTTAILGCCFLENSSRRWIEEYRLLLDQWKLWDVRARFDFDWNTYQKLIVQNSTFTECHARISIRCSFCNHPLTSSIKAPTSRALPRMGALGGSSGALSLSSRVHACLNCQKQLPRCSLCLLPLTIQIQSKEDRSSRRPSLDLKVSSGSSSVQNKDTLGSWIAWCQRCKHGGHSSHVREWFSSHDTCPVVDCDCKCGFE